MEPEDRAIGDPFEAPPIDFVDIGCRGALDAKWAELFPLLDYTGFDPGAEECRRLGGLSHPYRAARYLPYALAGRKGTQTLHLTESPSCCSLLTPNHRWLDRFSYARLFRETGETAVPCTTLDALAAEEGLRADILKLDTQGLELPILQAGTRVLSECLCVETETGFLENYVGETTYAQVDEFMRSRGFLMYDLAIHRVGRDNAMEALGTRQPMWCQAVWMFDFVGRETAPSPGRARKALRIARALRYYDYGMELALWCAARGVIDRGTMDSLARPEAWLPPVVEAVRKGPSSRTGKVLRFLPDGVKRRLLYGLKEICE